MTVRIRTAALLLPIAAACASHRAPAGPDDSALLSQLQATPRVVQGESTWVARGAGYELVGRTKRDLVMVQPQLDRAAILMRRLFPTESLAPVVVAVRHNIYEGQELRSAAPVPATKLPVVEVLLPPERAPRERGAAPDRQRPSGRRGGPPAGLPGGGMQGVMAAGMFASRDPVMPVIRAWLAAHASAVTHAPALSNVANGDAEDPRIPAWALTGVGALAADSASPRLAVILAAHPEVLYPLGDLLTSLRPPYTDPNESGGLGMRRAITTGGGGGSNGGGGGGMGGGGRGGRGGRGGGGGRSEDAASRMPTLDGGALFDAQSAEFARFLVMREGYDFIGALIDAQLTHVQVDALLASRRTLPLERLDADWKGWLAEMAKRESR